jgi:hypothetical protein
MSMGNWRTKWYGIVIGIRDSKLSEKLQLNPDPKLKDAINQVCRRETIQKQQYMIRNEPSLSGGASSVDAASKFKKQGHIKKYPFQLGKLNKTASGNNSKSAKPVCCYRCWNPQMHSGDGCPARSEKYNKLQKILTFCSKMPKHKQNRARIRWIVLRCNTRKCEFQWK